jgi:hypothetical protein
MPYNLPRFHEMYLAKESGWTFLMWGRRSAEEMWVSRYPYEIDQISAWKRHDADVRRYRRIQRLWKFGGKYFFRERLLAAF